LRIDAGTSATPCPYPTSVGKPLSFAGTPVAAGDLVVAEDDGVIVIPAASVASTLASGQMRAAKEARVMDALRNGRTTLDLLGLSKWRQA
jgi:4-hydroxy-4-methyl-2-oxoglutarate aldolase